MRQLLLKLTTFICLMGFCLLYSCKKKNKTPKEVTTQNPDNAATMATWKDGAMGVLYNAATNTVVYNAPDENGVYKIFLSDLNHTFETPLTYSAWPADRHQWAEEWSADGQYLFCYVEKTAYVTESDHNRVSADAIPGYGAYTDVWIIKRDGSQAWQLTNLPNDYDNGVCHGAISKDGMMFAWTERTKAPVVTDLNLMAGAYVFKVADVSYGSTPSLSNIRTFKPGGVDAGGEVESISNDKTNILVYSTFETKNLIATPIYLITISDGSTQRLTWESFAQSPTYNPNNDKIVYMTGQDCDIFPGQLQGADWWIMDADGSNKTRLTFMNVKNSSQSANAYRLAGSLSFVNDSTFLGGIMTSSFGLQGYTALTTFKP